jgi:hypothetical protein
MGTIGRIAGIVTGLRKGTSRVKLYGELGWDSLQNRRKKQKLILMFKALEGELPNYITIPNPVNKIAN